MCVLGEYADNSEIPDLGMKEEWGLGELVGVVKSAGPVAPFPGNTSTGHHFFLTFLF